MVRHVLLGAVAGGLILLTPYRALATQHTPFETPGSLLEAPAASPATATRAAAGGSPVAIYAVDNPAEPGDAFPNSPYSGGTD